MAGWRGGRNQSTHGWSNQTPQSFSDMQHSSYPIRHVHPRPALQAYGQLAYQGPSPAHNQYLAHSFFHQRFVGAGDFFRPAVFASNYTEPCHIQPSLPQPSQNYVQHQHSSTYLQHHPPATTAHDLGHHFQKTLSIVDAKNQKFFNQSSEQTTLSPAKKSAQDEEVCRKIEKTHITLDPYTADLQLQLSHDLYEAKPLTDPVGFTLCWAGVRCTHGVYGGKVYFELKVLQNLEVPTLDGHVDEHVNLLRVGVSTLHSGMQLGEVKNSYGFGSSGRFSTGNEFKAYGTSWGCGDVVGVLLDLQRSVLSFTLNGQALGEPVRLPSTDPRNALFPHVLAKNCSFRVNVGQETPWFSPPPDYTYIAHLCADQLVCGPKQPLRKSDCEVLLLVGLPGSGKTSWALKQQQRFPHHHFTILGTDALIDQMRVMGLPRYRNYSGRWDVLIDEATKCFNVLLKLASRQNRNFIIDQTNVKESARRRKLEPFRGFRRRAVVFVPSDAELKRRSSKRTKDDGKDVPESVLQSMKAMFTLPEVCDYLEHVDFVELPQSKAQVLVQQYNADAEVRSSAKRSMARPSDARNWRSASRCSEVDIWRSFSRLDKNQGRYSNLRPTESRQQYSSPRQKLSSAGQRNQWTKEAQSDQH